MKIRIVTALLVALLAHAGAYAIILVSSPKKADIQIAGGSISISLRPADEVSSEQSEFAGEDSMEQEEPAPQEPLPEPDQPEPVPESIEPDPAIAPTPEPPVEAADPVPDEPELAPEPEVEPVAEKEAVASEPDPMQHPEPDSVASTEAEANPSERTDQPAEPQPTDAQADPSQGNAGAAATSEPASDQIASADTPSGEIGNAARDNYNGALMRHMRRARKFDTDARRKSKIAIMIDAHGNILEVKVLRASGDKTWDRRVVKELKRIAPYPAPPSGGNHSWTFDAVPK